MGSSKASSSTPSAPAAAAKAAGARPGCSAPAAPPTGRRPATARRRASVPDRDDVGVPLVDPVVPHRKRNPGRRRHPHPDHPVEQRVPGDLALVQRHVPDRDTGPPVVVPRGQRLDQPAGPSPRTSAASRDRPSRASMAIAQYLGLSKFPTDSRPNPPWNSSGARPSSSKWSEATQCESASIRPSAEAMPRSRNAAAKTVSPTWWKCVGVVPHSVHQIGARPGRTTPAPAAGPAARCRTRAWTGSPAAGPSPSGGRAARRSSPPPPTKARPPAGRHPPP